MGCTRRVGGMGRMKHAIIMPKGQRKEPSRRILKALKVAATYSPTTQCSTIGDAVCGCGSAASLPRPCSLRAAMPRPSARHAPVSAHTARPTPSELPTADTARL